MAQRGFYAKTSKNLTRLKAFSVLLSNKPQKGVAEAKGKRVRLLSHFLLTFVAGLAPAVLAFLKFIWGSLCYNTWCNVRIYKKDGKTFHSNFRMLIREEISSLFTSHITTFNGGGFIYIL